METFFMTDRGQVRSHNEDNGGIFTNQDGVTLAIVADGMGGHRAGDVASMMTVKELQTKWEATSSLSTPDQIEKWLKDEINNVNTILFRHAQQNEECEGMGTTVVAAILTDEFVSVGHMGDSRGYLLNSHGFSQLTEDHSLVNELVRSGQISKEDAEFHPRKNVLLKALGTNLETSVDVKTVEVEPSDKLFLCSDGLTNKIHDEKLQELLRSEKSLQEIGKELVETANELGGEDNITVALVQFTSPERESR